MNRGRGSNGYRGRGSPKYRGRGNSSSPKGLFADGIWHCDCIPSRLPAEKFQVKKESPNKGRWFYTCQQSERSCNFFLWEDDAKPREEAAVLSGKRTEPQRERLQEGWNAGRLREEPEQPVEKGLFARNSVNGSFRDESTESPSPSPRIKSEAAESRTSKRSASAAELDNDEFGLNNVSEQDLARLANSIPPETPHKAQKQGVYATPGTTAVKRRLPWEAVPTTPAGRSNDSDSYFDSPSKRAAQAPSPGLEPHTPAAPPSLRSAASPSPPMRYKDALHNPEDSDVSMTHDVMQALATVKVPADVLENLRSICVKHDLKYQGVIKGRDMSRVATKAKDAKIAELHARIASLQAEWEVERSLNGMRKWESRRTEE